MIVCVVSVLVTGDLEYSSPQTRLAIQNLVETLEASDHISPHLSKSWLRHYQSVNSAKDYLLNTTQNYATEAEFVRAVADFYNASSNPYSLDIAFNEDKTRILASRFLVQGQNIHNTKDEEDMVIQIRQICDRLSSDEEGGFKANVFNSYFLYVDQYLTIFNQTLQCILTTGIIVVAVSLILLPDLLAAGVTVISIISTLVGTMGFMSVWGIVLDGITLINLVMCIGFSVDFSAHFSYHYIYLKQVEGHEDVVAPALVAVLKPILQGGVSTVLGLVGLIFAPSRGFVIFFKMVLIVIVLGVVHSLVLLPCLLQFIIDLKTTFHPKSKTPPKLVYMGRLQAASYDNEAYVEQHM